jgi:hypothetical protein
MRMVQKRRMGMERDGRTERRNEEKDIPAL